ncbi:hypothetical protein [Candidatus Nitrospira bockiana]
MVAERVSARVLIALLFVAVGGCAHVEDGSRSTLAPPTVATFYARDYGFQGPDVLPAGLTVIRIQNQGQEPHQVQLLKLANGKRSDDVLSALHLSFVQIPGWAKQMGGPNGVSAGGEAEAAVYLEPGSYAVVCLIPDRQGRPHVALGMQKPLHVVDRAAPAPTLTGNYHLVLTDFELTVLEEMVAGTHTFHVVNRGKQPHTVSVVRFDGDASNADVIAAFQPDARRALPGRLVGGVSGLEPGAEALFTVTLPPGRYGMICLFPNPSSPLSHAAKGMAMNFTIE